MRLIFLVAFLACSLFGQDRAFRPALPGYQFEFPRDHFAHPEFKTEWWYYTGNLRSAEGDSFGFELTFFREGVSNPYSNPSRWKIEQLYIAHLAVTDLRGGHFEYAQRMHRGALGVAGARTVSEYRAGGRGGTAATASSKTPPDANEMRVWVGDWSASIGSPAQRLNAQAKGIAVQLDLLPLKLPVVHGRDGISRKGPGPGNASHYYSFTRLQAQGLLRSAGKEYTVSGLAWMDHEFSSSVLSPSQVGWDWFSLQFDDGSELMLFQLRRRDGSLDPYSAGTYVLPEGVAIPLQAGQFRLQPRPDRIWGSPLSGGRYPLQWHVQIPSLEIDVEVAAALAQQELITNETTGISYWEGAVRATGQKGGQTALASGYLEMTGYAPESGPKAQRSNLPRPAGEMPEAASSGPMNSRAFGAF